MTAAAARQVPPPAQPPEEDLEALFDRIAAERREGEAAAEPAAVPPSAPADPEEVFQRVGQLTRQLHDALHALGYDKAVEAAAGTLPDARARLDYVGRLTGQAAERVLAATEKGQAQQQALQAEAAALAERWERAFGNQLAVAQFRELACDSRAFLGGMAARCAASRSVLSDIMMAQDFHDLTGQVIQRVVGIAQGVEEQLVKLLVETTPPGRRAAGEGFLSGPVVCSEGRADVVCDQRQVDELLDSLGF